MSAYSPFGSYSSTHTMSSPIEISSRSHPSSPDASQTYRHDKASSCAYPSWPRRDSLTVSDHRGLHRRATSFLSDVDLIFDSNVEDEDTRSVSTSSSSGSGGRSWTYSPVYGRAEPSVRDPYSAEACEDATRRQLQGQRQHRAALQRQALLMIREEKERRGAMRQRQAQRKKPSAPTTATSKARAAAAAAMDPIAE